MKKFLSFVLCLCMLLSISQITAYAYYYESKTEGDFEYAVNTPYGVAVTGYNGAEDDVIIPETLGGQTVEAIEDYAFSDNESLISVVLPESVKIIGQYSFAYCCNLKSINLESVELIAQSAFSGTAVEEANLKGAERIHAGAFRGCEKLNSVALPETFETVDSSAFANCNSLTDINLENVKSIKAYAFSGCSSLESVNLKSAESIGSDAFKSCKKLRNINIGSKVKEIWGKAFFKTAVYNDAVKNNKKAFYIGDYLINAFTDRTKGKFKVKSGTVLIADSAFSKASTDSAVKSTVTSVSIPDSVKTIGYKALNDKKIKKIRLPKDLKQLSGTAFSNSYKKKNQVFKGGCYYIGAYLVGCDKYALKLKIRKGTTLIANGAIVNSLATKLVIPNGVKYISDEAIVGCQRMRSVEIPKSVKFIGDGNFVNSRHGVQSTCKNLTKITVDKNNKKYSSKSGVLYNKAKTVLIAYPAGNKNKSFKVPSSVKAIKKNAFAFAPYLAQIKLSSKLEEIGETAFTNCKKLKSITVPESVKKIGCCAFGRLYFSDEDADGYSAVDGFTVYGKKGSAAEKFCNEIVYIRDYESDSDYISLPLDFKEV